MEFFLPLLALAVLYLFSWLASLYLLVQFILGIRVKRRLPLWSILWLSVWPFFALGVVADNLSWGHPFSMLELAGNFCTFFVPFLWLFALGLFRKTVVAEKRKSAEQERQFILDIRSRDDVWPPPPTG